MNQRSTASDGGNDMNGFGHFRQIGSFFQAGLCVGVDAVRALHRVRHGERADTADTTIAQRPRQGGTDHAAAELGDVVFVELPENGRALTAEEDCAVVESVKAVSEIFAPVSGIMISRLATMPLALRSRAASMMARVCISLISG